jgi:hypothetical protein
MADGLRYIPRMDQFTRERVLELSKEITSLQRENESYRQQRHHSVAGDHRNELRRLRLVAIQEELRKLGERQAKNPMIPRE